jgi:hypothetical protein
MPEGIYTMQSSLAQALEDLHTRIAATVLALDETALEWQPSPVFASFRELIRHAAAEERRWIGDGVANMPAGDDAHFSMLALSGRLPANHALFELGSVGQVSQMILNNLAPADWGAQRQVDGQMVTVADCVLRALVELARVLGHVELMAQLWDARAPQGSA